MMDDAPASQAGDMEQAGDEFEIENKLFLVRSPLLVILK